MREPVQGRQTKREAPAHDRTRPPRTNRPNDRTRLSRWTAAAVSCTAVAVGIFTWHRLSPAGTGPSPSANVSPLAARNEPSATPPLGRGLAAYDRAQVLGDHASAPAAHAGDLAGAPSRDAAASAPNGSSEVHALSAGETSGAAARAPHAEAGPRDVPVAPERSAIATEGGAALPANGVASRLGSGADAATMPAADAGVGTPPKAPDAESVQAPSAPTSSPSASSAAMAVRFAVIGDFGDGSHHEAAVAHLVRKFDPNFVITTGDDNYPMGQAATIDEHIGAFYADFIGNYRGRFGSGSATNRFWPTPGNHDWYAPGLVPYLEYFTLPGNERYYDVEQGLVHLFALDSDPNEPDGTTASSPQARWLHARLAASSHCYKVVYFHHPPFSSGPHGDAHAMQWPFRAWGADVVLAGHDHVYERFQVDGIPYFVNGLGGADKYPMSETPKPGSIARYNRSHGAMLVVAESDGITYEFWNVEGVKVDELNVPKRCGSGPR